MKQVPLLNFLAAAVALSSLLLPLTAAAQYIWLDEKGTKQFSDMPPPPSVPSSRILKQPAGALPPTQQESSDEKAVSPAKIEPTMTEKNVEFRKRKAEQAEKEKKAADEAARAAENARNCERARDYQRSLDSGERIVRTDKTGERAYLSDEQRAQESRENRRVLAECN